MANASSKGESRRRREAMRAASGRWPAKSQLRPVPPERTAPRTAPDTAIGGPRIFVSYSREDTAIVRKLILRLRADGVVVTWDQDFIAGSDYERAICEAIDVAHAVIVAWSPASVRSRYVHDEAQRAISSSKLITTHIAGFDLRDVPLGFGRLHTIPIDDQNSIRRALAERGLILRS